MLLPDEYKEALAAILQVIASDGDHRGMVALAVSDSTQRMKFLVAIGLDLRTTSDAALAILNLCVSDGFAANPSWLECILDHVNQRAQSPLLKAALARVKARQSPPSDAFDKAWLNQVPFFDRTLFRPLAKRLIGTTDLPVLRVNGPPGCGCTYTARALEEIAREYAQHVTVLAAEVPASQATVYQLEDLVGELLTFVPGGLPLPARTGSSYPSQLIRHTLSLAMGQTQTLIFVIDGAGATHVNDEIKLFAAGLAKDICRLVIRPRARLVLINHQQKLSVKPFDMRDEAVPDPADLNADDLARCLRDMQACRMAAGGAALSAPVYELAKLLLGEAPTDPRTRLEHLNGRLVDLFTS